MGPLTSYGIISGEWALVWAFVIGIGFGFVLEQAGFSSTRKLAGVFYGYDFTVLRVFFTAAITAIVGLTVLNYAGLMDMERIFVNPLNLKSAMLGGAIMGFGFVIGGYCPGTSMCAVAIGKIDAMFFVGGIFLGVLFFNEAYPLFEGIYKGTPGGSLKVHEVFGISHGLMALIVIVVALVAFYVTNKIETNVNSK